MSSITPSNLAGSIAQGALQQSQAARPADAQRNRAARHSQRMKELIEKHLELVEDSYRTSDEQLIVREHQRDHPQQRDQQREGEEQGASAEARADGSDAGPAAGDDDRPPPHTSRLDVTA